MTTFAKTLLNSAAIALTAVLGNLPVQATLERASITESVNSVSYQAGSGSVQKPAPAGTVIHPDAIVRTGVASRAELKFSDETIARMGANSIFSYDAHAQRMNLSQGSALFSKPKNDQSFEIATPAATCSISGTTGFLEVIPGAKGHVTFVFGLIEGHTSITLGGKTYPVGSGDLIVSTGAGLVHLMKFNVVDFMAKAGLARKFKSRLPNFVAIQEAEARYASLVERGFIEPTDLSFGTNGNELALIESFSVSPDQSTRQLGGQIQAFEQRLQNATGPSSGGFVNIGSGGVIRGQLVWNVPVDLDLHLILPGESGIVYYGNPTITFNSGHALARLDADNQGGVINVQPSSRVENIFVSGVPAAGTYTFFPVYYAGSESATYTLTTTSNNGATHQTVTGTISSPGQQGTSVQIVHN